MPAGYGKKKSTRRRVASEEIEDARPSQKEPNDDVSDDDAPAPSIKVKAEKKTGKGKGKGKAKAKAENPPSDDEEREDANDASGPNDLDLESLETTFQLLPADEATKTKLKGMASDWEGLSDQIANECNFFKDVAGNFAEVTGSLDSKEVLKMDELMRENMDVCAEMKANASALRSVHQMVLRGDPVKDPYAIFEGNLRKELDEYALKTKRQKYNNQRYLEFRSEIWNAIHTDKPMPPITSQIPKEAGDEEDDSDSDIEIGGTTQKLQCQISLKFLTDPLTSTVCRHSFDAQALREYFTQQGSSIVRCPSTGCNKRWSLRECKPDPELARKAKIDERRRGQATANVEEVEEVIE